MEGTALSLWTSSSIVKNPQKFINPLASINSQLGVKIVGLLSLWPHLIETGRRNFSSSPIFGLENLWTLVGTFLVIILGI